MKMIHCADLHLDSKMETNLTQDQAKKRRYEILDTFEQMIQYGLDQDVQVILIAGDLFDTAQNQQKTIKNRVLEAIRGASTIDFLYLQGNHDKDDYFKQLANPPANLKLFENTWTSYRYNQVVITGVEFANQEPAPLYDQLVLKESDFNIVTLHGQVTDYGEDKQVEVIKLKALQNKYIDYLALGHIHEHTEGKLDYRGVYCYPGCLEGRGFDECGQKGFVVLDIDQGHLITKFVSLAKRSIHEVPVDASQYTQTGDMIQVIEQRIGSISPQDMVKVILEGETMEEAEIDLSYIKRKFESRFYHFKLQDHTQLAIDYDKYEQDISLKGEFIRTVKALDLDSAQKLKMIKLGINAIVGKEVQL